MGHPRVLRFTRLWAGGRHTRAFGVLAALILLASSPPVFAKVLFEDGFDQDTKDLAASSGWSARYCGDGWRTDLSGGVVASTDDDCCGSGCNYAVYTDCAQSDALDNHITNGDEQWRDYRLQLRLKNSDDDAIGVVFRYQNTGNFYLLLLSRGQVPPPQSSCDGSTFKGARLVRIRQPPGDGSAPGEGVILAVSSRTYDMGAVHRLTVEVDGRRIRAWLDGDEATGTAPNHLIFDLEDGSDAALLNGRIGLWAYQNGAAEGPCAEPGACWFDDLRVTDLEDLPPPPPPALDTDGDGVRDQEDNCPKVENPLQRDLDDDGLGDVCDRDMDGDGLDNPDEKKLGSDPKDADSDDDGVVDGAERDPAADPDGDGDPNVLDADSDGDGLPDGLEVGRTRPHAHTDVAAGAYRADADPTTTTDPTRADSDGDGFSDGEEDPNGNGRLDPGEWDPNDPDSHPPGTPAPRPDATPSSPDVAPAPGDAAGGGGSSGGCAAGAPPAGTAPLPELLGLLALLLCFSRLGLKTRRV